MNLNEGVVIIGRTGGGKTSILKGLSPLLLDGSCLAFSAKQDDPDMYEQIICNAGRVGDLMRISPDSEYHFNPLTFEMNRKGGNALSLAQILTDINEVITRSDKAGEDFWEAHQTTCTTHAINVNHIALRNYASFETMYQFLSTLPENTVQARSAEFKGTKCGKMLALALQNARNEAERRQVVVATDYFMEQLPAAGDKVRGAVLSQVLNTIILFTMPPLSHYVNGESNINPMDCIQQGKCIVLDMDILTYGKMGQAFQLLHSFFFTEAVLRRSVTECPFTTFKDEYQIYAFPNRDIKAQTVARSQNYRSVIAFQTLPVLEEGLGGDMQARVQAKALYACHVNKFMCNNNCNQTNDENSKIIGSEKQLFWSMSPDHSAQKTGSMIDDFFGVGQTRFTGSQHFHPIVEPREFTKLKTGGQQNGFVVEAIYHNGFNHSKVTFKQR